jgi:hypothetical protein
MISGQAHPCSEFALKRGNRTAGAWLMDIAKRAANRGGISD